MPDIAPEPGDAVLFHTGWGSEWDDPVTYPSGEHPRGEEASDDRRAVRRLGDPDQEQSLPPSR